MPKHRDVHYIRHGLVYSERSSRTAVCSSHVPSFRAINAALTSPCASQSALASEGFPTWDNVHCLPGLCAARSSVTSVAQRTCTACRAGQPERIVPWTRSARSANRTRGAQHGELHTRARMRTHPFQIHTTLTYIFAVHVANLYPTWSVLAPDCDRADVRVQAMCETRHGPRTRRHANPAWLPRFKVPFPATPPYMPTWHLGATGPISDGPPVPNTLSLGPMAYSG